MVEQDRLIEITDTSDQPLEEGSADGVVSGGDSTPFHLLSREHQRRMLLKWALLGSGVAVAASIPGAVEATSAQPTVEEENTLQPPLVFSVGRFSTLPRESATILSKGGDALPALPLAAMAVPKPRLRKSDGSPYDDYIGAWSDGTPILPRYSTPQQYSLEPYGSSSLGADREQYYATRRRLLLFGAGGALAVALGGVAYAASRLFGKPKEALAATVESRSSTWYPNATPVAPGESPPQPLHLQPGGAGPIDEPEGIPFLPPGHEQSAQTENGFVRPRSDLYFPIPQHRELIDQNFVGSRGYWDSWKRTQLTQAFINSLDTAQAFNPNMSREKYLLPENFTQERAVYFAKIWNDICRDQFNYRYDAFTPYDQLPANMQPPQFSSETFARVGLLLRLIEVIPTVENVQYVADIIAYQALTQPESNTYLFSPGEFESINFTSQGFIDNDASLRLLNGVERLLGFISDPRVTTSYATNPDEPAKPMVVDIPWYLRDPFEQSPNFPQDQQALDLLIDQVSLQYGVPLGEVMQQALPAQGSPASQATSEMKQAPATGELDIAIANSAQYWSNYFAIPEHLVGILRAREGGRPEYIHIADGLYQVTLDNRQGWMFTIPTAHLRRLLSRNPSLINNLGMGSMEQVLNNLDQAEYAAAVRQEVFRRYSPSSGSPEDVSVALDIQTFIGLWFFEQKCLRFGNSQDGYYLSFLKYNHPKGVDVLLEQITEQTGASHYTAISIGNQAIEVIDNELYGRPPSTNVVVDPGSVTIIPKVRYEAPRDRFFWRIDVEAAFHLADDPTKQFTLTIPSAHYLWRFTINRQEDFVWQGGSGSALQEEHDRAGYSADAYAQEMMAELMDEPNNLSQEQAQALIQRLYDPRQGLFSHVSTGAGIMELIHNQ